MTLALGLLPALLLLIGPGLIVGFAARLTWPVAVAVAPALTYGVVGLAIVPFGAVGLRWNGWTALFALAVVTVAAAGLRVILDRVRDREAEDLAVAPLPALIVAAGVVFGVAVIGYAAIRGMQHWQSIPSTWDAVWHANEIRYILDTGQASPTHMGDLRNVETHAGLYYPSAFHALAAVLSQLTGASATTAYTLSSLAAAVWLFPVSAAALTWHLMRPRTPQWHLMRPRTPQWRAAGCAAAAAALSASFTSVPYIEFDTAAMPNLAAYGLAAPTMVLIVSTLRHRDRIPVAVLALLGVFSVHATGGILVALFVGAWWVCDGLWHPVRSRATDVVTLALVAAPAAVVLLPQFVGILRQADIIAGHEFVTHQGKRKALFDAVIGHTRHLNDFPIQWALRALAAVGGLILLVRRIWWPLAVCLLLVAAIVHSSAPYGTIVGTLVGKFGDTFYSDPRRLTAVITLLLTPMAGIALFTLATAAASWARRLVERRTTIRAPLWYGITAALIAIVVLVYSWHYFPRHRYLMGQKYDSVIIDRKDLQAMAYLATLPGARDTLIGDANIDGTAWMYAIVGLHPLWTHYDYPQQQGPGYHRYIFWAYADDADTDPRVAEAVRALNIRYVMTSTPVVRDFVMAEGLAALDKSHSWMKIYDNGGARIYEWRGGQ